MIMKKIFKVTTSVIASFAAFSMTTLSMCQANASAAVNKNSAQTSAGTVKNMKITICGYSGAYTGKMDNGKPEGYGVFQSIKPVMYYSLTMEGTWKGNHVTKAILTDIFYTKDKFFRYLKTIYKGDFINSKLEGNKKISNWFKIVIG
jgi:hypothetical protein